MPILDREEAMMYTVSTDRGKKLNFGLKKMYKQIQLTDKELELLASMIKYYISEKQDKPGFEINNAHIMLRHISGKLSHENRNQIAFLGK
jgi:hypothetical protein